MIINVLKTLLCLTLYINQMLKNNMRSWPVARGWVRTRQNRVFRRLSQIQNLAGDDSLYLSIFISIYPFNYLSIPHQTIHLLFVCSPLLIFLTLSMPSHIQYFPKKKPDGQNIKSQNFLLFQVSYHHHHWCIKTICQF